MMARPIASINEKDIHIDENATTQSAPGLWRRQGGHLSHFDSGGFFWSVSMTTVYWSTMADPRYWAFGWG